MREEKGREEDQPKDLRGFKLFMHNPFAFGGVNEKNSQ
jgi:hypothetical protein